MATDRGAAPLLNTLLPLSFLVLLLVMVAIGITQQGRRRFRFHTPYFAGCISVTVFCAWPALSDTLGTHPYPALLFAPLFGCSIFILFLAHRALTYETDERVTTYERSIDQPEPAWRQYTLVSIVLVVWTGAAAMQGHAIVWAAALFVRDPHRPTMLLDLLWACMLALPFVLLGVRALDRADVLRRKSNATPEPLRARVARLAPLMGMRTPRVASNNSGVSYAQHHLLLGPVICVSSRTLDALPSDLGDALILHELAHLKLHTGKLAILELIASFTLFGYGVISIIIDSRRLEFEADAMAARALSATGRPGYELMLQLISKTSSQRRKPTTNPEQHEQQDSTDSAWPLEALFLGDGALWYQHPSVPERTRALERRVPCPQ